MTADVKVFGRDDTPIALGQCVDLSYGGLKVHLGLKIDQGFPVSVAFDLARGGRRCASTGRSSGAQPDPARLRARACRS